MDKQEPYRGLIYQGCANCPPVEKIAPMDMMIAVGFGIAAVTKDGQPVYTESQDAESWDDFWTTQEAESAALEDPNHDWLIILEAPLRGRTYQRHAPRQWVLIESTPGFA
jgi:hypothetical protein